MGLKIPRQGLHWGLMILVGVGGIYALSPTYDSHGPNSLEEILKAKSGGANKPGIRAQENEALKKMLERSKSGEFDAVITPLWKQQQLHSEKNADNQQK